MSSYKCKVKQYGVILQEFVVKYISLRILGGLLHIV